MYIYIERERYIYIHLLIDIHIVCNTSFLRTIQLRMHQYFTHTEILTSQLKTDHFTKNGDSTDCGEI